MITPVRFSLLIENSIDSAILQATCPSIKLIENYLLLKLSLHHATCFDQHGHHQLFTIVDGDCCASISVVSISIMWSHLCACASHSDG
jgi:hypothetical protein